LASYGVCGEPTLDEGDHPQIFRTGRRTKGAARLTHWALKSTTCQSNVNSAASETLFPPARLKGILKSSDAIRRGNGEKIKLPSGQTGA
jgi:hypothetical protein